MHLMLLNQAILEASTLRFRPILMTTVTTVLGVMPLIISRDPLFYAMAILGPAIGYLAGGTFLKYYCDIGAVDLAT